jgi:hypothetical protein
VAEAARARACRLARDGAGPPRRAVQRVGGGVGRGRAPPSGCCTTRRCRPGPGRAPSTNTWSTCRSPWVNTGVYGRSASSASRRLRVTKSAGRTPLVMSHSHSAASNAASSSYVRQGHRRARLVRGEPGRCPARPRRADARPRGTPWRRRRRLRRRIPACTWSPGPSIPPARARSGGPHDGSRRSTPSPSPSATGSRPYCAPSMPRPGRAPGAGAARRQRRRQATKTIRAAGCAGNERVAAATLGGEGPIAAGRS